MNLPETGASDLLWRDGSLHYCGRSISELVEQTRTPAFVFSQAKLIDNHRQIAEAFALPNPWRLRIAYSVKTAWEPRLLRLLARMGTEAEVACEHEHQLALRSGFDPQATFLDGPAHTVDSVARIAGRGIRFVKIDSLDQLKTVAEAAGQAGAIEVSLRIKAPAAGWVRRPADILEGRFGMDREQLTKALAYIKKTPQLEYRGMAVHLGSQVITPRAYREGLKALGRAQALADSAGLPGREVNLGGGFPSPTLRSTSVMGLLQGLVGKAGSPVPRLDTFGESIRGMLTNGGFAGGVSELVVEPGRAIVGNASILLTRVVAVKKNWLVLDASHNFVPESLLFAARRFLPAEPESGQPWGRVNLAGSTLSGGDVLAMASRLPDCRVGDVLVMMDAGAYTLSRANRFTTLVPPAYLLDPDGELQLLRRKETAEDVVRESESW